MAIVFGSPEGRIILVQDKRRFGWMADVDGYGGCAPRPQRDDTGEFIWPEEWDEFEDEPVELGGGAIVRSGWDDEEGCEL